MADLFAKHYGKLVAFLVGWGAEALMDISAYIKALLP